MSLLIITLGVIIIVHQYVVIKQGREIMAAIDNLEANNVSLGAKLDEAISLLSSQPNNDARIQAVANSLKDKENQIQSVIDSSNG